MNNVGGPSAGMMFALGIIDTLTPGELNGGEQVAGTGTISADGTVGPIGGVRQKMWGAVDAGADWFLVSFGGALHSFTVKEANDPEHGMAYNEAADRRSWEMLKGFLAEAFK